jgi:Flp pilus assembly protein TadD
MRAYHGRDASPSRRSRPGLRRWHGFGVACLTTLTLAAGCQSFGGWIGKRRQPSQPPAQSSAPSPDGTMLGLGSPTAQNGPRAKPGPEQQFNVHLELGRMYEAQGYFDAAITEYQKALDATGRLARMPSGAKGGETRGGLAHRRMGGAYDRLGKFAQAEAHYREALKLSPNDPKVWNDAGYSYYLQRRWDDAERSLKTAAKIDPENPKIQTNLGLALAAAGKTDQALMALTKAGGPAIGHANLAYLLAALGKTAEARAHYLAALESKPDLAPAREALAALDGGPPRVAASPTSPADDVKPVVSTSTPPPVIAPSVAPPITTIAPAAVEPPRAVASPAPPPPVVAGPDANVTRASMEVPTTIPLPIPPGARSKATRPPTPVMPPANRTEAPTTIPWPRTMKRPPTSPSS